MTNEHVEELYSKFEKGVAKNKRVGLKTALENCNNEKYEDLRKLELKSKSPLRETLGLISWVALVFGCIFMIFNLIVYACLVPMNADRIEYATKLGADMSAYAKLANSELKDAYYYEGDAWLTDTTLKIYSSDNSYETLGDNLENFEKAYAAFAKSADDAYENYKKAVGNDAETALTDFQAAISTAESMFIEELQLLPVLEGSVDTAYSAYKTELNSYYSVLYEENSTKEEIAEARKTFDESSSKTNFDNLLITVKDYISKAKIIKNTKTDIATYKAEIAKYLADLDNYKKGKIENKPVRPDYLKEIAEYFGDDKSGAIKDLSTAYDAYTKANDAYELNMSSKPDGSTLLWWASPILEEVNRNVINPADLTAYQNAFIEHLNIYKAVINSLTDRLEVITNYYANDGVYLYAYYDEEKGELNFSYFNCNIKTMSTVQGSTDFSTCKEAFIKTVSDFEKFEYAVNLDTSDCLTADFNSGLSDAATAAINAAKAFDSAVAGMTGIKSQTNTLIRNYQSQSDMLSMITMVFDIIFSVILAVYSVTLILIYRSKAQEENIEIINNTINS